MTVPKMKKDGKVAVLVAPGYGAGWTTWNHGPDNLTETALFHRELVQLVLDGRQAEVTEELVLRLAGLADGYFYDNARHDLVVEWVDEGDRFRLTEYDGHEDLELLNLVKHYVA